MSRKGIEYGSITHHPDGIPHGPHPGRAEASIGAKYTNELAVMMDSFRPLKVAKAAMAIEDPNYHKSWLDAPARGVQPADELRAGCGTTPRADVCEPVPALEPGCGTVDTWTGVAGGGSHAAGVPGHRPPACCWQGCNSRKTTCGGRSGVRRNRNSVRARGEVGSEQRRRSAGRQRGQDGATGDSDVPGDEGASEGRVASGAGGRARRAAR